MARAFVFEAMLDAGQKRKGWIIVAAFLGAMAYLVLSHNVPGTGFIGCPFRWLTGLSCPGCGMTRATAHFLHGDPVGAVHYHPFGPLVLTAFAVVAAHYLVQNLVGRRLDYAALRLWKRVERPVLGAVAISMLLFGAIRLVLEVSGILTPI